MEDELTKLRRQILEEQRLREEERHQLKEERRLREDSEAQKAVSDRRLEEERRLREEEQRRGEEQRRLREESEAQRATAEKQSLIEQERRKAAENVAEQAQLDNITKYLENCHHKLSCSIRVVSDPTLTTKGDVTKPAGRLYPQRILPWKSFPAEQQKSWKLLASNSGFFSRRVFPSAHQLDFVQLNIDPIDSELELRRFASNALETHVKILVKQVYADEALRRRLELKGIVTFDSHTNLGEDEPLEEAMRQLSVSLNTSDEDGGDVASQVRKAFKATKSKPKGRKPGKGGQADEFCIYRRTDGQNIPAAAIEYKAPHKLPLETIVTGLSGEIAPKQDIINQDNESPEFLSKYVMAAVVTQCFSYMIGEGVQNGYIYTGEAIVFLHIPEDPTVVHYYVCVPNRDVQDDDDERFLRTAVAQVFAFILRALAVRPPALSWHDATEALETWAVEYIDILKKIPETERKKSPDASAYKPRKWKAFQRSPVRTRSRCLPTNRVEDKKSTSSEEEDDRAQSPLASTHHRKQKTGSRNDRSQQAKETRQTVDRSGQGTDSGETNLVRKQRIEDRPYCTHECLLGILHSRPLDRRCPNARFHRKKHIEQSELLGLVQRQLAADRGHDADCTPLYIQGARGALFKVRLSSHGYTFVAKGVEDFNRRHLHHELGIYEHVSALQGSCVPVCLGLVELERIYYHGRGQYTDMLLLSWAGQPLFKSINLENRDAFCERTTQALRELHALGLLHQDVELRNILYDEQSDRLMLVDLERAEKLAHGPLKPISVNRKRKRAGEEGKQVPRDDSFRREVKKFQTYLQFAVR